MKTSELTGAALDWAVAKAEGYKIERLIRGEYCDFGGLCIIREGQMPSEIGNRDHYSPTKRWDIGGPMIERKEIWFEKSNYKEHGAVFAYMGEANMAIRPKDSYSFGPDRLTAAMRCIVASVLGDEIEIPPELSC